MTGYPASSRTLALLLALCVSAASADVFRPRGVALSKKVFYDPSKDFTCIDGSLTIPFTRVNDDYCDCQDGSDEPGTPACPKNTFNCPNIGYFEKELHSSKVNDGICDCCDGSDEYSSSAACENNCQELGSVAREAYRKQQELLKSGGQIREQYKQHASARQAEIRGQIDELKKQLEQLAEEKQAKADAKTSAEEAEKVALGRHSQAQEQRRLQFEAEEVAKARETEHKVALEAFKELDLNQDAVLSYLELMNFPKFDQNGDGLVTEDEARFFLQNKESIDVNEFVTLGWALIKPFYLKDKTIEQTDPNIEHVEQPQQPQQPPQPDHSAEQLAEHEQPEHGNGYEPAPENADNIKDEEFIDDNEEEDDKYDTKYDYSKDSASDSASDPASDVGLEYDEETKQIVEQAKQVKQEFADVESRFQQTDSRLRDLEASLSTDYGSENEFLILHGQCFEYTDREYTYKLCPFDRASQRPKDGGGSEVNLGRWGRWTGPESDRYSSFKLESGTICWNGPPRTVDVVLSCGAENVVISATEPSRCEYRFEFLTPAACHYRAESSSYSHTEL